MKKGFTLIELLAVIIIVGIIGIITIPMTMGAIENARKSAFEAGAKSVLDAAITYVTRVEETGEIPEGGIKVEDISEEIQNEEYISGVIIKNSEGSIVLEGLSDGEFCASGTKNDLRVIKGNCSDLDNTPPTLKVMLSKRTSNSITILSQGQDVTSGIRGYSYSTDGVNYSDITNNNIYTVTGLKRNETVKIYVRVYNNVYEEKGNAENLSYSMTEKVVEYTTLNIEKPEFKITTSENSSATVKIVEIIYPENLEGNTYSYIISDIETKIDGTSTRLTILENCEITARITTKDNQIIENKLIIAGIDNQGPVADIQYSETWEQSKTIKINVLSEQTGLPSEPYSYDGGLTWTSSDEKTYVRIEDLTGKIQVRDVLGNVTKDFTVNGEEPEEIIIDYVDKVSPTCALNPSGKLGKNNWYIGDVNIIFATKYDEAEYCENGQCIIKQPGSGIRGYEIDMPRIISDGTTTVTGTVVDNAGNETECKLTIKKDDNKPNKPTIAATDGIESGKWHNKIYMLRFSGSDNENISGITYEYSTDGENYTIGNNVVISEDTAGTTYYVKACSGAGICSDVSVYEAKLDTIAPSVPSTPDLLAEHDTGSSDEDNITKWWRQVKVQGTAEPYTTIKLTNDANEVLGTGNVDNDGKYIIAIDLQRNSWNNIYASSTDEAGNSTLNGNSLKVYSDIVAPTKPIITYNGGANTCSWKNDYDLTISTREVMKIDRFEIDIDGNGVAEHNINEDISTNKKGNLQINFIPWNTYSSCTNRFRAVDIAGNESEWTEPQHIHMDTEPPIAPSIPDLIDEHDTGNNASDNITKWWHQVQLQGTADPYTTIHLIKDDTIIGTGTADANGNWLIAVDLKENSWNDIYASSTDGAGNTTKQTGYLSVYSDTTVPIVSTNIDSGKYVTGTKVTLNASDINYTYMHVHVFKDGVKQADKSTGETGTTDQQFDVSLDSSGTWTVMAFLHDKAGNMSSEWQSYSYTIVDACSDTRYDQSNGQWGDCSKSCGGGTQIYYETRTYYSNLTDEYCSTEENVNTGTTRACNTQACSSGGSSGGTSEDSTCETSCKYRGNTIIPGRQWTCDSHQHTVGGYYQIYCCNSCTNVCTPKTSSPKWVCPVSPYGAADGWGIVSG